MITITRLPQQALPWRYALRITSIDADTFHKFVDALKMFIPPRARKWDAPSNCWLLRDCADVIALIERFGIEYECADADAEPPRTPPPAQLEAFRTLYLLPTAPPCVIQAAYRALAKQRHPDAGGDTATMQQLNRALEVLHG